MRRTDVIIVGAGQAGLAMSCELASAGIEHVILERGRVAERWRSTTWDSLRLLSPNWMTRLPHWQYRGPNPDGYMGRDAVIQFLSSYAGAIAAPVVGDSPVLQVSRTAAGYELRTPGDTWQCRVLVIATGHCEAPRIPAMAQSIDAAITQIHSSAYRNPAQLPPGNVLVVGASPSGVQIAYELARAGRGVALAVGRHTPLPRMFMGRDIFWWMDRLGVLDEPASAVTNIDAAREQPSLQLAGRPDHSDLNLMVLQRLGVRLAGRLSGAEGLSVAFADDLATTVRRAEEKRDRLLRDIADFAWAHGIVGDRRMPGRFAPRPGPEAFDLAHVAIRTIVWATGFARDFRWLGLPVVRPDGELAHEEGVLPLPGLYALGFRFLRRRNSSFIDGVGADAAFLARKIAADLGGRKLMAA